MLRSRPARSLSRSALRLVNSSGGRTTTSFACRNTRSNSAAYLVSSQQPGGLSSTVHKPFSTALQRYATTSGTPFDHIDKKHEKVIAKSEIEAHPEEVSSISSVHQIFEEKGVEEPEKDEDMLAGVWEDLRTIKETFALPEVPREALVIGMAGVLPYLATSLSTVYLAWDINHAAINGSGFLVSGPTAELMLHVIEPIQIGYGAVIISFLGAIHWGLEWAKYGGTFGYKRYAIGVVAPAVAWPTMLMPIEYALITQFCTFTFLYFADARSVVRGWAPHWYSTYRFVLTFVVGASIVISLIGRGQIADKIGRLPGPADRIKALRDSQMESLETEEREKRAMILARNDGGDEDEEEEDEEEEE